MIYSSRWPLDFLRPVPMYDSSSTGGSFVFLDRDDVFPALSLLLVVFLVSPRTMMTNGSDVEFV